MESAEILAVIGASTKPIDPRSKLAGHVLLRIAKTAEKHSEAEPQPRHKRRKGTLFAFAIYPPLCGQSLRGNPNFAEPQGATNLVHRRFSPARR
jgi:hypothetical protein